MRRIASVVSLLGALLLASPGASPQTNSQEERNSIVFVFADGRQQSFAVADISRIEFRDSAMIVSRGGRQQRFPVAEIARIEFTTSPGSASAMGRGRFVGKWKVGQGNGSNFYITLERNWEALKSIGATHGIWTVVDGEARISWDDGWHDAIRKVGNKFEKVAFEPGKTFSDAPANVTEAQNTSPEPI
jgi:hypothetical protein